MEQIELQAAKREILGKKVRFLRRRGIIPVHLFGHNIESLALQCDGAQLQRVLAQTEGTGLINLRLDKAKRLRKVIVREIQREPPTGALLHVDFYQVKMTEKVKVEVPIVLIGAASALKSKDNTLLQELNTLTVECLPDQIPANVEVSLSSLTEAEQAIRVRDIILAEEITILNAPEIIVVKISSRPIEVVEEVVTAEEAGEAPEAASLAEEEPKEK